MATETNCPGCINCGGPIDADEGCAPLIWVDNHGHRCEHGYCAGCCGCEDENEDGGR